MKRLLLFLLPLSLFSQEAFRERYEPFLERAFEADTFELHGTDSAGIVTINDVIAGSYSLDVMRKSIDLDLPESNSIQKIEFRNDEEPITVGWAASEKKDIEVVLGILSSHAIVESQKGIIRNFSSGKEMTFEVCSEAYFACSNGIYITLTGGSVIWIKGHSGQEFFTVYREDRDSLGFINMPLGLFLESVIPLNKRESLPDADLED